MSSQDVGSQLGFFHTLKLAEITADVSDRLVSSIFVILEDHKILCHIVAQVTGMHVVHAVDVRLQRPRHVGHEVALGTSVLRPSLTKVVLVHLMLP